MRGIYGRDLHKFVGFGQKNCATFSVGWEPPDRLRCESIGGL